MALTLKIENETNLPDGGPLSISIQGKRGIDIGRDQYLDWTLPDPSRTISGKHCEIRWNDGAYWLHDVSKNGTFLYGADGRLKEPHRLRNGDRFAIGQYIILAIVDDDGPATGSPMTRAAAPNYDELWNPVGEVAPPIDPQQLKSAHDFRPVKADFLQWAVDVPPSDFSPPNAPASQQSRSAAVDDMGWAQGTPKPPAPKPEVAPVPTPRRPVWMNAEPNGPWTAPASTPSPAAANAVGAAKSPGLSAPGAPSAASADRPGIEPARAPPRDLRNAPVGPDAAATTDFMRLVARGAGLPDDALAARDPAELAGEIGLLIRMLTESTRQLLEARQQAKRLTRSSNQTMIQALNNNPLKFAPTAEDALRIMFGPPTRSYLDARHAFAQSFDDLKSHQVKTFSAMQHALKLLLSEFDPEIIDKTSKADHGLASVVGSRKARLWDIYQTRWQTRTQSNEDGMLNAFMNYFAEYYDLDGDGTP